MPVVLDRLKFTNALVGHAHVAMAAMVTSFNIVAMASVCDRHGVNTRHISSPVIFWMWHGGCMIFFLTLTFTGIVEYYHSGSIFRPDSVINAAYIIRLAAGGMMLLASLSWLARFYDLPILVITKNADRNSCRKNHLSSSTVGVPELVMPLQDCP
jgi:cytochrome c oxidase cbb3-type subunit 1